MRHPRSCNIGPGGAASRGRRGARWVGMGLAALFVGLLAVFVWRPASLSESGLAVADAARGKPSLSVAVQPLESVSGQTLQPSPSVRLTDAKGKPASGVLVHAILQPAAFAAGSAVQVTTDSEGKAVFEVLQVDKAGAYRLDFAANGYPAAQTAEFVVRFGIPRVLTLVREPQGGAAGAPVGGEPAVRVTDGAGNPVPGINVDLLLESATGSNASKLATVRSDGEGLAVFSDVIAPAAGNGYRLRFDARAAGVNDVVSSPFNLTNS